MKIRSLLVICLCLFAPLSAVAEEILSQSYAIENVRQVEVGHAATIEIHQGATESLSVEAAAEVLARVTVDVKGDRLILGVENKRGGLFSWFGNNDDEVKFIVQVIDLKSLKLSGAVHAEIGALQGRDLHVDASGASHSRFEGLSLELLSLELSGASHAVIGEVRLERLKIEGSGASKAELKGKGELAELNLHFSGASKYYGRGLAVDRARVEASGASNVDIGKVESLEVSASGASNVRYAGRPRIKQNTSGASNVNSWED